MSALPVQLSRKVATPVWAAEKLTRRHFRPCEPVESAIAVDRVRVCGAATAGIGDKMVDNEKVSTSVALSKCPCSTLNTRVLHWRPCLPDAAISRHDVRYRDTRGE